MEKAVIFHTDGKHAEIEVGEVTVELALAFLKSKGWGSGFLEPEEKVSLLDPKEVLKKGKNYCFVPNAAEAPVPDLTVNVHKAKSQKEKEKPKKDKADHVIVLVAPHTLRKLQEQLEDREEDLVIETYVLSIPHGPEVDEQIFATKAAEHVNLGTPLEVVVN